MTLKAVLLQGSRLLFLGLELLGPFLILGFLLIQRALFFGQALFPLLEFFIRVLQLGVPLLELAQALFQGVFRFLQRLLIPRQQASFLGEVGQL